MFGGPSEDILIGGTTAHDGDNAALLAILGEWTSGHSYDTRIANIHGGLNGVPALDSTTVLDDGAVDRLLVRGLHRRETSPYRG